MPLRHRIQFPAFNTNKLQQDEVTFYVVDGDQKLELRCHDYDKIYSFPGLYEQIFYERLQCTSPEKVGMLLKNALDINQQNFSELRVLDLGAGNGMMGEILKGFGVARLLGIDIIAEAKEACVSNQPGVYDDYYVSDFTSLSPESIREISTWTIDCLTSVAALGFGDIPPEAFFAHFSSLL